MWKRLYDRLEIRAPVGGFAPRPSQSVLQAFGRSRGFRFPASYGAFAQVFGAGQIGGYFNIFVPAYPNRESGNLDDFQALYREEEVRECLVSTYGDEAFVIRMEPFSNTIGGDVIVWDPQDVRNKRTHEYAIYALPDDSDEIVELASTFSEFVEVVCLGEGFSRLANAPDWQPPQEFLPFGLREPYRRPPGSKK